jgi:predicted AlkP superfamily pyrophosphatase or phosphodiesterase
MLKWCGFFLLFYILYSCKDEQVVSNDFLTERVVVIVVDGPRWSETWGDTTYSNIPVRAQLRSQGVLLTNFYNQGATYTNPGHTAIATGVYDPIDNTGQELPHFPGILQEYQRWMGRTGVSYLTASKDKLWVLSQTSYASYEGTPIQIDCGVNGDGTGGYRADSITFQHVMQQLSAGIPEMMLINFKDPDYYGHAGDSMAYIQAIQQTDAYIGSIVQLLQSNSTYAGKTTIIITNDHGRHTVGWSSGFVGHGDDCEGCRHIEFLAISPDFKQGVTLSTAYEQRDIARTIAYLFNRAWKYGQGRVMSELFK